MCHNIFATIAIVLTMLLSGSAIGQKPSLNPRNDDGLNREAAAVERLHLSRFADERQLDRAIAQRLLVRVPDNGKGFKLDPQVGHHAERIGNVDDFKFVRPWTREFILNLGRQYADRTHGDQFTITSLVRTCKYQRRIAHHNGNAAPCEKTSHTAGTTIDVSWARLESDQAWFHQVLLALEGQGKILATKEHGQAVFHIMVLPTYGTRAPLVAQKEKAKKPKEKLVEYAQRQSARGRRK